MDNGRGFCDGQRTRKGNIFRKCWGCPYLQGGGTIGQDKKRDMKLSDYNISRAKYNELKYFCMQYAEKRENLKKGMA